MEGAAIRTSVDRGYLAALVAVVVIQAVSLAVQLGTDMPMPLASAAMALFVGACILRIHGLWGGMSFLALVILIPFASEFAGVLTGLPYGPYRYVAAPEPWVLGLVPVFILVAWVGIGYMAIATTTLALGRSRWWLAPLDGLIATAWDLMVDPLAVRANYWTWDPAGSFYGVPLTNFLGWFLVVTLMSLAARRAWARDARLQSRVPRFMFGLAPAVLLTSSIVFGIEAAFYGFPWAAALGLGILVPAVVLATTRLRSMPREVPASRPWAVPAPALLAGPERASEP